MRDDLLRQDDRALVLGAQRGSLHASERLVGRYQQELLRTAYLLTGSGPGALHLVEQSVQEVLRAIRKIDPDANFRTRLLSGLAREYLGAFEIEEDDPTLHTLVNQGPARFNVDTERTRVRSALALIDKRARAALVLSDFNELELASVSAAIQRPSDDIYTMIEHARQRLRELAEISLNRSLRLTLNEAAIDAPRTELWPLLESDVAEIYEREQFRSKALTYGAIGLVTAILIGTLAVLVFGALGNGADSVTAVPTTALIATPASTIAPPPTAVYQPVGSVPDTWLLSSYIQETGTSQDIAVNPESPAASASLPGYLATISPNGTQLFFIARRNQDGSIVDTVTAVSSSTLEQQWTFDTEPRSNIPRQTKPLQIAVARDRVYLAMVDPGYRPDLIQTIVLNRDTGVEVDAGETDAQTADDSAGVDAYLFVDPDQTELTTIAESHADFSINVRRSSLTGDSGGASGQSDNQPVFDFSRALPTPDGNGLYVPPQPVTGNHTVVQFFGYDTLMTTELALPFNPVADGLQSAMIVESLPSHDGRWLYVLSPYDQQIAIIDLQRRVLDRVVPLDTGSTNASAPGDTNAGVSPSIYGGRSIVLSASGEYLYAVGTAHPGDGGNATNLWKIDTQTWKIAAEWFTDSTTPILSIGLDASAQTLAVFLSGTGLGSQAGPQPGKLELVDTETGNITPVTADDLAGYHIVGSFADLYSQHYGHSPATDGVAPQDNRDFQSLPITNVTVKPDQIAPGAEVTLQVRLLDPADRKPLSATTPRVRFDPLATVTGTFSNGQGQQFLILGRDDFGAYSGRTIISQPGEWTLAITVDAGDAGNWTVNAQTITVQNIITGTDGRDYVLAGLTIPEQPFVDREVEMSVRFVDLASGEPMPQGISPEGGFPVRLEVGPVDENSTVLQFRDFYRSGTSTYSGFIRFRVLGPNLVRVKFPTPDTSGLTAIIGPIIVRGLE